MVSSGGVERRSGGITPTLYPEAAGVQKLEQRHGTSFGKPTRLAFAILPQRFVGKLVQFAGPNVSFDLPVPLALMPLDDPARKVPEIRFRQLLDCSFDFFHFAHGPKLPLAGPLFNLQLQVRA